MTYGTTSRKRIAIQNRNNKLILTFDLTPWGSVDWRTETDDTEKAARDHESASPLRLLSWVRLAFGVGE
eukprot:scaffold376563_cov31-Prasinocladus_malaysianus.AAC.1